MSNPVDLLFQLLSQGFGGLQSSGASSGVTKVRDEAPHAARARKGRRPTSHVM